MLKLTLSLLVVLSFSTSLTINNEDGVVVKMEDVYPIGYQLGSSMEQQPTSIEVLSGGSKLKGGLLLPAPPSVIKLNKQNNNLNNSQPLPNQTPPPTIKQQNQPKPGSNIKIQTTIQNQPSTTKPTTIVKATPTTKAAPIIAAMTSIPMQIASNTIQMATNILPKAVTPSIIGNWSFNVINSLKQLYTIPVEITPTQINFSYCNSIALGYKTNRSEISIYLMSQLINSCPNLSPSQSKILSSITNVDSFNFNGTKLSLQLGGVSKVVLTKI